MALIDGCEAPTCKCIFANVTFFIVFRVAKLLCIIIDKSSATAKYNYEGKNLATISSFRYNKPKIIKTRSIIPANICKHMWVYMNKMIKDKRRSSKMDV